MGSDAAMTLTDLPLECLAHALRFLPAADVSRAMASCATLRDVGGSETMWRWLSWRDFGIVPPPGPLRADPARGGLHPEAAFRAGAPWRRLYAHVRRELTEAPVLTPWRRELALPDRSDSWVSVRDGRLVETADAPTVPRRRQMRDADAERGPGSSRRRPPVLRAQCLYCDGGVDENDPRHGPAAVFDADDADRFYCSAASGNVHLVACFVEGDVAEAHAREERRMDRRAYMTERCSLLASVNRRLIAAQSLPETDPEASRGVEEVIAACRAEREATGARFDFAGWRDEDLENFFVHYLVRARGEFMGNGPGDRLALLLFDDFDLDSTDNLDSSFRDLERARGVAMEAAHERRAKILDVDRPHVPRAEPRPIVEVELLAAMREARRQGRDAERRRGRSGSGDGVPRRVARGARLGPRAATEHAEMLRLFSSRLALREFTDAYWRDERRIGFFSPCWPREGPPPATGAFPRDGEGETNANGDEEETGGDEEETGGDSDDGETPERRGMGAKRKAAQRFTVVARDARGDRSRDRPHHPSSFARRQIARRLGTACDIGDSEDSGHSDSDVSPVGSSSEDEEDEVDGAPGWLASRRYAADPDLMPVVRSSPWPRVGGVVTEVEVSREGQFTCPVKCGVIFFSPGPSREDLDACAARLARTESETRAKRKQKKPLASPRGPRAAGEGEDEIGSDAGSDFDDSDSGDDDDSSRVFATDPDAAAVAAWVRESVRRGCSAFDGVETFDALRTAADRGAVPPPIAAHSSAPTADSAGGVYAEFEPPREIPDANDRDSRGFAPAAWFRFDDRVEGEPSDTLRIALEKPRWARLMCVKLVACENLMREWEDDHEAPNVDVRGVYAFGARVDLDAFGVGVGGEGGERREPPGKCAHRFEEFRRARRNADGPKVTPFEKIFSLAEKRARQMN